MTTLAELQSGVVELRDKIAYALTTKHIPDNEVYHSYQVALIHLDKAIQSKDLSEYGANMDVAEFWINRAKAYKNWKP